MTFVDTNILIRLLGGDDPHKADRCQQLFHAAKAGRIKLFLTHLVIAETVWILSKKYGVPKSSLAESLRRLLNTPHVFCDNAPLIIAALDLLESKPISFIDAYHTLTLPTRGITEFYSYDTDFDQLTGAGITRKEP